MRILILAVALAILSVVPGAKAAMMVIDNANLAKNAETAAKTVELLSETKNVLAQITGVAASIGGSGGIGNGSLGKIFKGGGSPSDVLGAGGGITGISPDLSDLSSVIGGLGGGNKGMETYSKALRVVKRVIRAAGAGSSNSSLFAVEAARVRFAETSAEEALAAGVYNRNQVATSARRVEKVAAAATAAVTVREQLGVLTSAVLLMVEEQQQTRALLATYVQMSAARNFRPDRAPLAAVTPVEVSSPPAPAGRGVFNN